METRKCFIRRSTLVSTSLSSLPGQNCWEEEEDCYSLNVTWKWRFWEPLCHPDRALMTGVSVHPKESQGIPMFPDDSLWGGRQASVFGTGLRMPSLRESFVYNLPGLRYFTISNFSGLRHDWRDISQHLTQYFCATNKGGKWGTKANDGAHISISTWTPVGKRHAVARRGWWRDSRTHYI